MAPGAVGTQCLTLEVPWRGYNTSEEKGSVMHSGKRDSLFLASLNYLDKD